jgi:hypothetical protein
MPITLPKTLVAVVAGLVGLGLVSPSSASAAPGDPESTARFSVVYPLTTPESRTALLSSATLASYTSPTGVLTRELDAVIDTPAAIGIDPMILASIRVLGTSAPVSALEWLDRLATASNETFALTYADSDITAALQAGAPAVVTPTSFDFAVDPSLFAAVDSESDSETDGDTDAGSTETPEPSASPTPGTAPALPTAESLVAWDYSIRSLAWPVAGTVVAGDLPVIAASGYSTTLLGSGNLQRADPARARVTVGGTSEIVVTDDPLSELFGTTVDAPTIGDWQSSLGRLQAAVDATAVQGGATGASVVLAVDRTSLGSAARLADTLASIEALPSSTVVPFSTVLDDPTAPGTIIDQPQPAERVAATRALLATEASDAGFATVAENPSLITGERRLRLLATLSTGWQSYPGGWTSALELYNEESLALHDSVKVVRSSDISLFADRASLPVTVSNSLGQPVTVVLAVTAPTPLLKIVEPTITVALEPESQKRGQVPVQSLSNGTAQIAVTVTSTTGVPVGTTTTVRINVYAGWETPITVALAVIVFAVFVFGIARVIVRRRRARAAGLEEAAE